MRKSRIRKISTKRKAILSEEAIIEKLLLEKCGGSCMVCGQFPDWRGLMKEHHYGGKRRKAKDFILVCGKCASRQHGIIEK